MNPKKAKMQWTDDMLPDLVRSANFLSYDSLLKDALRPLCVNFSHLSTIEINSLLKRLQNMKEILLHCGSENPPDDWELRNEAHNFQICAYCY